MVYKRLKSDICLRLLSQRHGQLRSWTLWRRGFTTLFVYFESQCVTMPEDKKKFVKTWEMKIDDKDCEATQQGW